MKISENLLAQTRIDEETGRLLEKYIEGFSYYLPIYNKISIFLPEKNDEGLIDVCNMSLLDDGSVALTEGDFLDYNTQPELVDVITSCQGKSFCVTESKSDVLYLPICHNSSEPIGILKLSKTSGLMDLCTEKYLETIKNYDRMNKIYDSCFTKFILDPVFFRDPDGNVQNINATAELFKGRICDGDEEWFSHLWEENKRNFTLEEIISHKICMGTDHMIGKYDFFVMILPLYMQEDDRGVVICVNDVSQFKELLKEVMKKSMMIREVHHRVKNNLQTVSSLLELQSRRSKSFMVEKVLIESINRISSIALVHEELSKREENTVDMRECIHSIMTMILNNMVDPNKQITGEITGRDIFLSSSQASSVSLCVTELIQNCVKHAFAFRRNGTIVVTLDQINREVIISIEDDGVGISAKKAKGQSLGLQIVRTITSETLKGTFKLESHTYGTIAEIRFHI